jgi:hypothetical protein
MGNSFKLVLKENQGFIEIINGVNTVLISINDNLNVELLTELMHDYKNSVMGKNKNSYIN